MKRGPPDPVSGLPSGKPGVGGPKRGPPGAVSGLPGGKAGGRCPITANWEALSVAINTIEPTDVRLRRNLVIIFISFMIF